MDDLLPRDRRHSLILWCARAREAISLGDATPEWLTQSLRAALRGRDPDGTDGGQLLMLAMREMPRATLAEALAITDGIEGAGLNTQTLGKMGRGALHSACFQRRSTGWIQALLSRGHDPSAPDEQGDTPLHDCAAQGTVDGARALILAGAPLMAPNRFGLVPEQMASGDLLAFLSSAREAREIGGEIEAGEDDSDRRSGRRSL